MYKEYDIVAFTESLMSIDLMIFSSGSVRCICTEIILPFKCLDLSWL